MDETGSVTVTVPAVGLPPLLATVSVKMFPVVPCTNVPLDDFVIVNPGNVEVWIVTVLLVALALPPPLTVAVFITVAGAVATLTGIVIAGY